MRRISFVIWISLLVGHSLAAPQETGKTKSESVAMDSSPIEKAARAYEAAYNKGDAATLESLWTEEAIYTNRTTGNVIKSRKKIAEEFKKTFASGKKSTMALTTDSVQFISPTVAVEHGTASIESKGSDPETYVYTAVYVKQGNQWLLDRVTDDEAPIPHPSQQLQTLEWIIGSWRGGSSDSEVRIESNWATNRSFISRTFTITEGKEAFSGTQIIGWDPINQRIRSWTFDQDGTYAEGTWSNRGDSWTITNQGVLSDGKKSGMVNVMTKIDANTISWKTLDRAAAGKLLPNIGEVILLRE